MLFKKKQIYRCDGICESCKYGKEFKEKDAVYFTCDPKKVKGLKVIAPSLR